MFIENSKVKFSLYRLAHPFELNISLDCNKFFVIISPFFSLVRLFSHKFCVICKCTENKFKNRTVSSLQKTYTKKYFFLFFLYLFIHTLSKGIK